MPPILLNDDDADDDDDNEASHRYRGKIIAENSTSLLTPGLCVCVCIIRLLVCVCVCVCSIITFPEDCSLLLTETFVSRGNVRASWSFNCILNIYGSFFISDATCNILSLSKKLKTQQKFIIICIYNVRNIIRLCRKFFQAQKKWLFIFLISW